MMGIFGKSKPVDPKEQVNEWTKKIRKEGYNIDRQINGIKREELKVTRSLKEAAKKGDKDVCLILAKEVVHARKSVNKLYTAKANLNSIQLQMKGQLATLKVTGALQTSTEVMKSMQSLVRLPEIQKTMQELSREMMKAGILEEMVEDTMEGLEGEEEEDAAQEEIDKILLELTAGALGTAPDALKDTLPASRDEVPEPEEDDVEDDLEEMKSRLEALRS
ncbi:charged multivesicular body protein 3 isoform X1 [Eurytemora carolleeae]|uniref:charged multivesicular body protein 3 isoform X1 n=1 Tax=Eurytemora carolleeae TaxID=1294199 RepID=UPI000C77C548|nr:charged multivesicular body protein 3 isoform X1 [Eurytemora carolleeae]|eukprot:XP_023322141.1 charged multivesicular body protein 3-like isoform X1 [Eurytemora affinis]